MSRRTDDEQKAKAAPLTSSLLERKGQASPNGFTDPPEPPERPVPGHAPIVIRAVAPPPDPSNEETGHESPESGSDSSIESRGLADLAPEERTAAIREVFANEDREANDGPADRDQDQDRDTAGFGDLPLGESGEAAQGEQPEIVPDSLADSLADPAAETDQAPATTSELAANIDAVLKLGAKTGPPPLEPRFAEFTPEAAGRDGASAKRRRMAFVSLGVAVVVVAAAVWLWQGGTFDGEGEDRAARPAFPSGAVSSPASPEPAPAPPVSAEIVPVRPVAPPTVVVAVPPLEPVPAPAPPQAVSGADEPAVTESPVEPAAESAPAPAAPAAASVAPAPAPAAPADASSAPAPEPTAPETTAPETTAPEPTAPEPPAASAKPQDGDAAGGAAPAATETASAVPQSDPSPAQAAREPPSPAEPAPLPAAAIPAPPAAAIPAPPAAAVPAPPAAAKPPAESPVATPVAKRPAPPAAPQIATAGRYFVQISSLLSAASAKREWARLQRAHPAILGGREADVQRATVKGRVYHRLRTGGFETRREAGSLCARLKTRKQDCLVVRR